MTIYISYIESTNYLLTHYDAPLNDPMLAPLSHEHILDLQKRLEQLLA